MTDEDLLPPGIDPGTRKLAVRSVRGASAGTSRTDVVIRDFPAMVIDEPASLGGTDEGPSPLEVLLASLVGCEGMVIHGCARAMGFRYTGVRFETSGTFDVRGARGVPGVRPYFESVTLAVTLATGEPPERVARLRRNVEHRCPVVNLLRDAGVVLEMDWRIEASADQTDQER